MAALPTNITPGTTGHAAIHNATNTAVNTLSAQLATMGNVAIPVYPSGADVSALPVGSVFGFYDLPAAEAPTVRGFAAGTVAAASTVTINPASPPGTTVTSGGVTPVAGDLMIVTLLVPDAPSGLTWTLPAGWVAVPSISAQGSITPWIFMGVAAGPGSVTFSASTTTSGEFQHACVWLAGAGGPSDVTVGGIKRRTSAPTETTTVTCPSVTAPGYALAVSVAFERTIAEETAAHTWSSGWSSVLSASHDNNNSCTTDISTKTMVASGATGDAVISYPNPQANNGLGLQLLVPGLPA